MRTQDFVCIENLVSLEPSNFMSKYACKRL
uniref:Uncharacterized protein n=1 Tax=Rhizophora mucronata TaxID=61149 RepID=A0A2P2QYK6_RHIMU